MKRYQFARLSFSFTDTKGNHLTLEQYRSLLARGYLFDFFLNGVYYLKAPSAD